MARPLVRKVLHVASFAVVFVVALVAYAAYTERSAEQMAKEFCSTIKTGEKVSELLERTKFSGANERQTRWHGSNGNRWLAVTFTGFTPLSRHICSVRAAETVASAKYVYLD